MDTPGNTDGKHRKEAQMGNASRKHMWGIQKETHKEKGWTRTRETHNGNTEGETHRGNTGWKHMRETHHGNIKRKRNTETYDGTYEENT